MLLSCLCCIFISTRDDVIALWSLSSFLGCEPSPSRCINLKASFGAYIVSNLCSFFYICITSWNLCTNTVGLSDDDDDEMLVEAQL